MNESTEVITFNQSLEATQWMAERADVLARAEHVTQVTNAEELDIAAHLEKDAKRLVKTLSAKRLEFTRPLDNAKKLITEAEKREAKELNALIDRLDALNVAYAREQARKAEEERRRIEAAERAAAEAALEAQRKAEEEAAKAAAANAAFGFGETPAVPAPVAAPPLQILAPVPTVQKAHSSAASFTEVWDFEVVDPAAVPRELCSPDPAKIRAVLAARKSEGYRPEQVAISGLRIYMDVQVRAR